MKIRAKMDPKYLKKIQKIAAGAQWTDRPVHKIRARIP